MIIVVTYVGANGTEKNIKILLDVQKLLGIALFLLRFPIWFAQRNLHHPLNK